jgi:hypothetical protein
MDNSNDCVMILPEIAKEVSVKNLAFIIFLALPWDLGLPRTCFFSVSLLCRQDHQWDREKIGGFPCRQ